MMTFSEILTSIILDLNQCGFVNEADDLQRLANLALDEDESPNTRHDALKQIEMRCHVKWLGDLFLPHLSQNDWWGKLEKLRNLTRKKRQFI